MVQLGLEQVQAYMSDYLQNGWREEQMEFAYVALEPGYLDARVDVKHFHMPGDGRFHFSAQSALIWISQLGIIYGCWDNQLEEKAGEVYLRNIDISFRRSINKTEQVRFEGFFPKHCKKKLSEELVYYKDAQIYIESGAFTGNASFMVPLRNGALV